jgi:hypothetical protein
MHLFLNHKYYGNSFAKCLNMSDLLACFLFCSFIFIAFRLLFHSERHMFCLDDLFNATCHYFAHSYSLPFGFRFVSSDMYFVSMFYSMRHVVILLLLIRCLSAFVSFRAICLCLNVLFNATCHYFAHSYSLPFGFRFVLSDMYFVSMFYLMRHVIILLIRIRCLSAFVSF